MSDRMDGKWDTRDPLRTKSGIDAPDALHHIVNRDIERMERVRESTDFKSHDATTNRICNLIHRRK
ncbi:MAG: hypothetical protein GY786_02770 [Proteobacteria bacterium]|nr:hypothetical protein [Pseudomonadota bacterium]